MKQEVTILLPHYKTCDLTKICLRLLKKYTDLNLAHVIVIDNDSQDSSTEYLRSLPWIELIERPAVPGEDGPTAHGKALDLALERVKTPYVLSLHTDSFVKRPDWLEYLLAQIKRDEKIGGVGSWKLENKPFIKRLAKKIEFHWQKRYYQLIGKTDHRLQGVGKNHYYIRSHCALYRMDVIKDNQLCFTNDETVGKVIHTKMVGLGYTMKLLPSEDLCPYLEHLNHATVVLNPQLGSRKATITKGRKRIIKSLERFDYKTILADHSLDY